MRTSVGRFSTNALAAARAAVIRLGSTSVALMLRDTSTARIIVCCRNGRVRRASGRAIATIARIIANRNSRGGTCRRSPWPGVSAWRIRLKLAKRSAVLFFRRTISTYAPTSIGTASRKPKHAGHWKPSQSFLRLPSAPAGSAAHRHEVLHRRAHAVLTLALRTVQLNACPPGQALAISDSTSGFHQGQRTAVPHVKAGYMAAIVACPTTAKERALQTARCSTNVHPSPSALTETAQKSAHGLFAFLSCMPSCEVG